jgi:peroxidase
MFTQRQHGRGPASCLTKRVLGAVLVLPLIVVAAQGAAAIGGDRGRSSAGRALDGRGNNRDHRQWGRANVPYRRDADAAYGDEVGAMADGPSPRAVSNRIFNDVAQNTFSENGVTQWGFAWGQFIDHTIGLRQTEGGEEADLPYDASDPLERFRNDFGAISFERTPAAPDTGSDGEPRQQINTVDSYIDASAVYSNDPDRLEWLREGPVDGDLSNNSALLLLPDDQLPTVTARGDAASAPATDARGRLMGAPDQAVVAGDVRANENVALQATQLLFAREHNRIVRALPADLPEQRKFDIARRVVGAEQQYITYREFLPSFGVRLDRYEGYDPRVDATLSNEFATVGYRVHSVVHGELEPMADLTAHTEEQVEAIEGQGIEVEEEDGERVYVIPLGVASFNPALVPEIGLGPILRGLGGESEYKNDEQIDDQLRSVLFEVPMPGVTDPAACLDGAELPNCFQGVVDLGALDIQRGRDHGMPSYNDMREAYGLPRKASFTDITGEATDEFPDDPEIDAADPIDDPDILDVVELRDRGGEVLALDSEEAEAEAVTNVRRTTVAARLRALYEDVDDVDAFVGMMAERHIPGVEMGELQNAMWRDQFTRLRDGDRFFYKNDRQLGAIRERYGIDYRRTLAQVIVDNTELEPGDVEANVFRLPDAQQLAPPVSLRPAGQPPRPSGPSGQAGGTGQPGQSGQSGRMSWWWPSQHR